MTRRLRLPLIAAVPAAIAVALSVPTGGNPPAASGEAAHMRLAAALAATAPDASGSAPKRSRAQRRDRTLKAIRRVLRGMNGRFRSDGRHLLAALRAKDAGSNQGARRLVEATARMRSTARDVLAGLRRVKARSYLGRRGRRRAVDAQKASVNALSTVQRFVLTNDAGAALRHLRRGEVRLTAATRLTRSASRRLGCRYACGSGF